MMKHSLSRLMLSASAFAIAATGVTFTTISTSDAAVSELIVTARKREESLQDAAVSVTALTSEAFREQSISSMKDIAQQMPGLTFQESFGRRDDRPGLRGFTSIGTPDFGVESGTAIFIDGVYVNADTSALGLNDIQRVEVVRGPQSALYGRNTYAGAINIITAGPGDELGGYASARIAEHDEYEVAVGVSGPIAEGKLSGGLNARYYEYGGEWKNAFNGNTMGSEETTSISANLKFTPTDNITMQGRLAYAEDDDGHIPIYMVGANTDFSGNGILPAGGDDYFVGEFPSPSGGTVGFIRDDLLTVTGMERETLIATVRTDIELDGGYTLSLLGGYHDQERKTGADSTPDAANLASTLFIIQGELDKTDWSLEARIASPEEDRVRWTLGAFYYDEDREDTTYTIGALGFETDGPSTRDTENWAVFGSLAADITEDLTATLEVRYAEDKKSVGVADPASTKFSSTNPRFILEYEATDDHLLYASIAKGNKPGGFNNPDNRDTTPPAVILGGVPSPSFDEETSWNYEIGAKTSWLDNRLQLNGAIFFSEAEDVQLTQNYAWFMGPGFTNLRAGSHIINIEKVEALGGELELRAAPTENLDITFGYAYVDSEIQEGFVRDQGRLIPPLFASTGPTTTVAGKKFPRISEHQINASITYTHQLANGGELYGNLNGSYESERFVQVHNLAIIPESTVVNGRLGMRMNGFDMALFGKNLFDEDSPVDGLRYRDGGFARAFQLAARRGQQFGVELRKDF